MYFSKFTLEYFKDIHLGFYSRKYSFFEQSCLKISEKYNTSTFKLDLRRIYCYTVIMSPVTRRRGYWHCILPMSVSPSVPRVVSAQ